MRRHLLPRVMTATVALVLRLAPREFRLRFGREMLDTTERSLRETGACAGRGAMLGLWARGLADALAVAWRERRVSHRAAGPPTPAWADIGSDVRYALRGWRRSPGFSLTAVSTLALGLGLTAAVFSFADGYLFRPLPFPGGDRTYFVTDPNADIASALKATDVVALRESPVASYGFVEWSAGHLDGDLVIGDRTAPVSSYEVSAGFRDTLRVPLVAGRDFTADDHIAGAPIAAWVSHRFWQREFGGDLSVVGRLFRLESLRGESQIRIVGILGPEVASFDLNNRPPDLVVPARQVGPVGPGALSFPLVLLPEDVSVEQATRRISDVLQAVAPSADARPRTIRLSPLNEAQVRGGAPTARVLLAGGLLVLLLAAINLIHLLLGRSVVRRHEVATRAALGASRWRVVRTFLVESLLIGAAGLAGGLLVGKLLSGLIEASVPELPSGGRNLALVPMLFDWRVVACAVGLGLVISLAGGLWPAWIALRGPRDAQMRSSPGMSQAFPGRLARWILVSELTVATMVIVGAVFVGLGIHRYLNQPLGFEYAGRVRISIWSPSGRSLSGDQAVAVAGAVRSVPGIAVAGFERPVVNARDVDVPGQAVDTADMLALGATPGYFDTWGMHMRRGRWFDEAEFASAADVVVVDDRVAQRVWPESDPVGQTVRAGGRPRTVVGVVQARREMLDRDLPPAVYVPVAESTGRTPIVAWAPTAAVDDLNQRVTGAVQAIVPGAVVNVSAITFETLFLRGIGEARFQAPIVLVFGLLAIALAGVGVFGLMSYVVERRTHEFGIRLALGAGAGDVWRAVMRESLTPALLGLLLGAAGAWAAESVVQASVFGWTSSGPLAFVLVAIGLLAVATAAALIPAARATRVDPVATLRSQ